MIQLGGLLVRHIRPLLKTGLPLIGNVLKPLTKSVLIPLVIKGVCETLENLVKEQKGEFLSMLGTSLLRNMLAGKTVTRAGKGTIRAGKGTGFFNAESSFNQF